MVTGTGNKKVTEKLLKPIVAHPVINLSQTLLLEGRLKLVRQSFNYFHKSSL
jgi:hypothetical protein